MDTKTKTESKSADNDRLAEEARREKDREEARREKDREQMELVRRDLMVIQEEEEEEFTPYTGYYITGGGDRVFCMQGEDMDMTACGQDCGYCGRCDY